LKKISINKKRLLTIAHYIGVICEYFLVIFFATWLDNILKFPNLFFFPLKIFGLILITFGIILIFWTSWLQFKIGKGTTGFSEPTKKLVTYGPYGIVRNPMMEGQFLFFTGIGFLLDILSIFIILVLLIPAIHAFTIFIEEPNLKRRFGQKYIDYCKNVPRWLPKFRRIKNNTSIK